MTDTFEKLILELSETGAPRELVDDLTEVKFATEELEEMVAKDIILDMVDFKRPPLRNDVARKLAERIVGTDILANMRDGLSLPAAMHELFRKERLRRGLYRGQPTVTHCPSCTAAVRACVGDFARSNALAEDLMDDIVGEEADRIADAEREREVDRLGSGV